MVLINISVIYANTPVIIKTIPSIGEIVDSKAVKKIKIFFTKPLNVKTINIFTVIFQKFNGEKLFGKVDYTPSNSCIIFSPAMKLEKNSKYILYIKTGLSSPEGENMSKEFKLVFSTRGEKKFSSTTLIGDMNPLPNEKNVNTNIKIFIRFKDEIDQSSLNLYTFRVLDDSGNIYGDIQYNSSEYTAVFEPIPDLDENTTYKVILDTSIKFTSGKILDSDFSWSFTTAKGNSIFSLNKKKLFNKPKLINRKNSNGSFVFGNGVEVSSNRNALKKSTQAVTDLSEQFAAINDKSEVNISVNSMKSTKFPEKQKNVTLANSFIHPGDLLEITVYNKKGLKEVSEKVRVYLDGMLTFPFAGTITAAGKNVLAIKKELEKVLGNYYIQPRVDVWFQKKSAKLENIRITVLGEVARKGALKIARDARLIDILSQSGLTKDSDLKNVQISRAGEKIVVDCSLITGHLENEFPDVEMHDGDIIIVPVNKTKNQ